MAIYKTSNPALNEKTFSNITADTASEGAMTIEGTVNKIGILLLFVIASSFWVWHLYSLYNDPQVIIPYLAVGGIGGFIVAIVTIFNKKIAYITAPIYCLLEGLVLGGLWVLINAAYPGVAIEAITLTFGILFSLLILYRFKIIKATENFKMMVFSATAGIAIYYVIDIVAGFFGVHMPLINDSGTWGIVFSLFVVVIASLNLVVDFDFIEQGAQNNAPKYIGVVRRFRFNGNLNMAIP
jgi:uncharacterized YccA/Bax inhibitor family protein